MKVKTVGDCVFAKTERSPELHVSLKPEEVMPTTPGAEFPALSVIRAIAGPPESPLHVSPPEVPSNFAKRKSLLTSEATIVEPRSAL